jgi:di/tricarboxylate transporter
MLTQQIVMALAILGVAVILFVSERLRADLIALLVLLTLALTGLLTSEQAISGFSHPAVVTVMGAFVISAALFETGVAQTISRYVTRIAGTSQTRLMITIALAVALVSAVMDNVGATAVMLPVVVSLARQNNIRPSKLLIPLAYGALQGGLLTMIARPSNIIVSEALQKATGQPFGFFGFTALGALLLAVGITYMVLIGRRLLPERAVQDKLEAVLAVQRKTLEQYHLGERLFEARVLPESSLVNRTIEESRLGRTLELNVVGIVRNGSSILSPGPDHMLASDDLLLIQGKPEEIMRLRWTQGVEIEHEIAHLHLEDLVSPDLAVVEAVLTPKSGLVGRTLRSLDFRREHGVTVLAIWRDGRPYRTALGNIPLRFGDTMLLQGTPANIYRLSQEPDLLVLGDEHAPGGARPERAPIAMAILFLMIGLVALEITSVVIGVLLAAVLMVVSGCLTLDEAYESIEWQPVFLMVGMLPLGLALSETGTASYLAEKIIAVTGHLGPHALLAGIFLFNLLASQLMSSVAAAALMAPIAISTAQTASMDPRAFLVAVAVSGSFAFMTPIGHQANVLVMGPGGYRFTDYTRVGVPLAALLSVISIILLPILWPL